MNIAVKELSKREVQKITKKAEYEGRIYPSKRFGDMVIIEYLNCKEVVIKFLNTGCVVTESLSSIKSGEIRDKSLPTTCGVGFIDIEGAAPKGIMTPVYKTWKAMLQRCYDEKELIKYTSYKDCTVSESFKYFSKFKKWYDKQVGHDVKGWHLDKDILVKGNKVYSEDTCCFIPPEINCALVTSGSRRGQHPQGVIYNSTKTRYRARIQRGNKWESLGAYDTPEEAFAAYKPAKEAHIKSLAEKYRDKIDQKAYDALMNWTVEITD